MTSPVLSTHRALAGVPPTAPFIRVPLFPTLLFRARPAKPRAPIAARSYTGCDRRVTEGCDYNPRVSTELSIQRRDDDRGVVLTLFGELDVVSAPELERTLSEVLEAHHARVMLDLNGLDFVDSAGISVLIKAKQRAEANGLTFVLRRPTEQLERVFALVGLADWLEIED
jgi:anti-sigma B factor antagonist